MCEEIHLSMQKHIFLVNLILRQEYDLSSADNNNHFLNLNITVYLHSLVHHLGKRYQGNPGMNDVIKDWINLWLIT